MPGSVADDKTTCTGDQVARFVKRHFLWLLLGCYALALFWPEPGLVMRQWEWSPGRLPDVQLSLPLLLLAVMLVLAALLTDLAQIRPISRQPILLCLASAPSGSDRLSWSSLPGMSYLGRRWPGDDRIARRPRAGGRDARRQFIGRLDAKRGRQPGLGPRAGRAEHFAQPLGRRPSCSAVWACRSRPKSRPIAKHS